MNKRILAYSIATPTIILLFTLALMQTSSSFIAYGQITDTATATAATTGGQNTFSAKGSINSLVIEDDAQQQQQQTSMQFNNEQTSYVLDGK